MQLRKVPQSYHSGKKWMWIMKGLKQYKSIKQAYSWQPFLSSSWVTHSWQLDYRIYDEDNIYQRDF